MLKLSKMELSGFKSFYQRTEIEFPDGITAVVGPNGCGKSNISDAISWVLGSQSSKALRGSRMEDVIFNGSEKRGPLGMAEVTLALTWSGNGANGEAAGDFFPRPEVFEAALAAGEVEGNGGSPHAEPEPVPAAAGNGAAAAESAPAPDASLPAAGGAASGPVPSGEPAPEGEREGVEPAYALSPTLYAFPPREGEEIRVTRRLFRDGESEYRINGHRCRLRDIQDLMQLARIGSRTYAVIEQGRISQILAARPKERKELIEEAAGILGFKSRRRSALLKLEAAETNLGRLRDLLGELRRQIGALRRQAARARRFRRTAEEIDRHRRVLLHQEHAELSATLERIASELSGLVTGETAAAAALAGEEARLAAARQRIDEEGRGASDRRDELHGREREVDRLDAAATACAERIREAEELARRRGEEAAAWAREAEEARLRAVDLAQEKDASAAGLADLERDLAGVESRYTEGLAAADALSRQAEQARNSLFAAVTLVGEARHRLLRVEERGAHLAARRERTTREIEDGARRREEAQRLLAAATAALEAATRAAGEAGAELTATDEAKAAAVLQAEACRERLAAAVRELDALEARAEALAAHETPATGGQEGASCGAPLAEGIEVEPRWEAGAGAWLDPLLRARILPDAATALAEERALAGGGRVRIVVPDLVRDPGAGEREVDGLRQVLRGDAGRVRLLAAAAGQPRLAPDLASAVDLYRRTPGRPVLTPDGSGITAEGVIVMGGGESGAGILALNRQRREALAGATVLRAERGGLDAEVEAAAANLQAAETAAEQARQRLEAAGRSEVEARMRVERHRHDLEEAARSTAVLESEAAVWADEAAANEIEGKAAASAITAAEAEQARAQEHADRTQGSLDDLRASIQTLASDRAERKSACAARREALLAAEREIERLGTEAESRTSQAAAARQEILDLGARAAAQAEERDRLLTQRAEAARGAALLRERCRADEMSLTEARAEVESTEAVARAARQALEEARASVQAKEVERVRALSDVDHVARACREAFQCAIEEIAASLSEEDRALPAAEIRGRIERLEKVRERLGQINMLALEQYSEVEEREKDLAGQQEDLEASVRSLRATIQRIDRTSRDRLLHAMEAIRTEFGRVFVQLFGGGVADVVLEEPEDVLESGIEIIAQPPGKRTRSINLLSGGEKSLAALALLFAIFRYRPSPFCLLDEVDAALDEANVERFTRLLKEYGDHTQFILITHNRRSMEVADVLYGVTMAEPGVSQTVSLELDA